MYLAFSAFCLPIHIHVQIVNVKFKIHAVVFEVSFEATVDDGHQIITIAHIEPMAQVS